jgi:hypothetical protein
MDWACFLSEHPELARSPIQKPFVVGAIVAPLNCLDLTDAGCLSILGQAYTEYTQTMNAAKVPLPKNEKGHSAEVDLVIEQANGEIHAVEIKRTLSPKLTRGLVESMETLGAHQGFLVIPEGDAYPLSKSVIAVGLRTFLETTH